MADLQVLDNDEGLDVVDLIKSYVAQKPSGTVALTLAELITLLQRENFLGSDTEDAEMYYDLVAIALAELYLQFQTNGELDYDDGDPAENLQERVREFTGDAKSVAYLQHCLADILEKKEDAGQEREVIADWRESGQLEAWLNHVADLQKGLED